MGSSAAHRRLRVAIACPGVGLSQRGCERMFMDLFALVRDELDATFFKGGGATGNHEVVLPFIPRNSVLLERLPIHRLAGRTPIHVESMTFAMALLPYLRNNRFDIVHCIDPPLARILYKLRTRFRMRFKLLYTQGCTMPPTDYPPADHLQQVGKEAHQEALMSGIPKSAMTLLPCGFHTSRFEVAKSKRELRREYGVHEEAFVILSIGALNRSHKRMDHLIDEAAQLKGNCLLWIDGSMDQGEPDLVDYAKSRLGERSRITHVPSGQVGELYRMADVMVHSAVSESFGLTLVEAASTGLPVLCHNGPHFQWLVPNPRCWVDMKSAGMLTQRLESLLAQPQGLCDMLCMEDSRNRFSWDALRQEYLTMYARVFALPDAGQTNTRVNFFRQVHV